MSQISVKKVTPKELDIIKVAAKEAGVLQRKLMTEADVTLLAGFKANPSLVINQADRSAFQTATANVIEKWKAKPFGDFVARLVAAARK
jgi:TRAP-type C4-dicarboxylate transport system substrate-binding protein